jgi:hypothetical protein
MSEDVKLEQKPKHNRYQWSHWTTPVFRQRLTRHLASAERLEQVIEKATLGNII